MEAQVYSITEGLYQSAGISHYWSHGNKDSFRTAYGMTGSSSQDRQSQPLLSHFGTLRSVFLFNIQSLRAGEQVGFIVPTNGALEQDSKSLLLPAHLSNR